MLLAAKYAMVHHEAPRPAEQAIRHARMSRTSAIAEANMPPPNDEGFL